MLSSASPAISLCLSLPLSASVPASSPSSLSPSLLHFHYVPSLPPAPEPPQEQDFTSFFFWVNLFSPSLAFCSLQAVRRASPTLPLVVFFLTAPSSYFFLLCEPLASLLFLIFTEKGGKKKQKYAAVLSGEAAEGSRFLLLWLLPSVPAAAVGRPSLRDTCHHRVGHQPGGAFE